MHMIKETEEAFYYDDFPEDKFFVIRWLADGGYHYYPASDGQVPTNYNSEREAIAELKEWHHDFEQDYGVNYKVISGKEASKYPVPKRW